MIVCQVVVGGGKRFFRNGVRLDPEPIGGRRFGNGVLIVRSGVPGAARGIAAESSRNPGVNVRSH